MLQRICVCLSYSCIQLCIAFALAQKIQISLNFINFLRERERNKEREIKRFRDKEIERNRVRKRQSQREIELGRERDRERETERARGIETERERDRQKYRDLNKERVQKRERSIKKTKEIDIQKTIMILNIVKSDKTQCMVTIIIEPCVRIQIRIYKGQI